MREILFKAKRVDNGEWVDGFYTQQWHETTGGDYTNDSVLHIMYPAVEYYQVEPDGYEVIPETVCQYTGLRDKNGQLIFEGDRVDYEDDGELDGAKMIVTFDGACFFKKLTTQSGAVFNISFDKLDRENLVVTGNIHDTTEDTE